MDRLQAIPAQDRCVAQATEGLAEVYGSTGRPREDGCARHVRDCRCCLHPELARDPDVECHEGYTDPGPFVVRVVDFGRPVERRVSIFGDEPRSELEAIVRDAFCQYAPPTWQVRVGTAASSPLRRCRAR